MDLAVELRSARSAHNRLRGAFGGWVRRGIKFDAERREQEREAQGDPVGFAVSTEWQKLQKATLRLVAFNRRYLWSRFGLFAMRIADCTPFGDRFFPRLAATLKSVGDRSRIQHFDGERWELCMRFWSVYVDNLRFNWPYRKLRALLVKIIVNYELLKCRRRDRAPTPESIRTWLRRNGW